MLKKRCRLPGAGRGPKLWDPIRPRLGTPSGPDPPRVSLSVADSTALCIIFAMHIFTWAVLRSQPGQELILVISKVFGMLDARITINSHHQRGAQAYYELALQHHPDKGAQALNDETFKKIRHAWTIKEVMSSIRIGIRSQQLSGINLPRGGTVTMANHLLYEWDVCCSSSV